MLDIIEERPSEARSPHGGDFFPSEMSDTIGSVLDGLPAHVALIDVHGTIFSVNEAWRQFGTANKLNTPGFGVGQNYLDVCDRAAEDTSIEAAGVAAGIRAVLQGELLKFVIDYPCHSTTERRWFRLQVSPIGKSTVSGAALTHSNVAEGELSQSEVQASGERFRKTFEQAAVGMAHVAPDGRFLRVNAKLCDILGYSAEELMRLTFQDLSRPEDRDEGNKASLAMLAGTQNSYFAEKRYRRKNGVMFWVDLVTTLARDAAGEPQYFISVIEDISLRKLAELRLQRLNRLYTVLSRVGAAIVRSSDQRYLLECVCQIAVENGHLATALVVMLDEDSGAAVPMASWGGRYPKGLEMMMNGGCLTQGTARTAMRTGRHDVSNDLSSDPRFQLFLASEATNDFRAIASFPLRSNEKTVGALILCATEVNYFQEDEIRLMDAVAEDVSFALDALRKEELRLASEDLLRTSEERYRQSEEMLQSIFNASRDGVLVENDGVIVYINQSYLKLVGYDGPEDLVGSDISRLVSPAEYERLTGFGRRLVGEPVPTLYEFFLRKRDGKFVEVEGAVSTSTVNGKHYTTTSVRDISERKRLEQQFLRSQRMESVGTLAGGIAHDLNNLLMPIVMGVSLLKRFEPAEKSVKVIENIERSAKRAAELVKQVLSFARGVEGSRVAVHLGDIVREVVAITENTFPRNITFESNIPRDLWSVAGDPTQISQVLLNLCLNARDAMPNGGQVHVSAEKVEISEQNSVDHPGVTAGTYVVLSVADSGSGMSKEVVDRIFEPFFTTKKLGQGTGLGLSTSIGIVRSHRGFMNVDSEPLKGTTFRVYFPPRPEMTLAVDTDPNALLSPRRGHGELILVVDDEAAVLSITKQTLEAFGYNVVTAINGEEAIERYQIERDGIALVLTDMMMPGMSGLELIERLRLIEPAAMIVAATGLDDQANVDRAESAGVNRILLKPYSAEVLMETVFAVLEQASAEKVMS